VRDLFAQATSSTPPVQPLLDAFNGVTTGMEIVAVGMLVFILAAAGVCMYFSWFDLHVGGFIKRILIAALGGSLLVGGAGALGSWLAGLFHIGSGAAAAGVILGPWFGF
jgi:hypothetical protein